MKILAVDQARHGAWAIGDTDTGELLLYDVFSFSKKYTYAQVVMGIEDLVNRLINENKIDAVYIEDIQMRCNVLSFKKLAQLQGVLINMMEKNGTPYYTVAPSKWQSYCRAENAAMGTGKHGNLAGKKESKTLSLEFVRNKYGIETSDDNLSDAISILAYSINKIQHGEES